MRHWTVHNIPAAAAQLPQGAGNDPSRLPIGVNPRTNDFQNTGAAGADGNHGGPCPRWAISRIVIVDETDRALSP
ncbi:hypothetical protein ACTJLC_27345 [Paraburkholderia sp. 22099]|uniref:hypothetical protein n=1 Tax=Paraburkholderia TaxID=1822464 RepID=UPI0035B53494